MEPRKECVLEGKIPPPSPERVTLPPPSSGTQTLRAAELAAVVGALPALANRKRVTKNTLPRCETAGLGEHIAAGTVLGTKPWTSHFPLAFGETPWCSPEQLNHVTEVESQSRLLLLSRLIADSQPRAARWDLWERGLGRSFRASSPPVLSHRGGRGACPWLPGHSPAPLLPVTLPGTHASTELTSRPCLWEAVGGCLFPLRFLVCTDLPL